MKNVIITGITGQDGIFLTEKILKNNKKVNIYGISRESKNNFFKKLNYLGIRNFENINLINLNLTNYTEVDSFIAKCNPSMVFNLSGPSSVYKSLSLNTNYESIIEKIFTNLTDALIKNDLYPNFYQASSSEMFEDSSTNSLNEKSPFAPRSPYAIAKYNIHKKVIDFNKIYNWNIVSGIMFNHESEFRKEEYLFIKIIDSCIEIKKGNKKNLVIGSLDYIRDWSYAKDVVNSIYEITNNFKNSVYVIGSGNGTKIKDVVEKAFTYLDLDYKKYIKIDKSLLRKDDPLSIVSNPINLKNDYEIQEFINVDKIIEKIFNYKLR